MFLLSGPVSVLHLAIVLFGFAQWTFQQTSISHTAHVKGMQKRSVHVRIAPHNWGKRKKHHNLIQPVHLSGNTDKGVNGSYQLHHSRSKQFQHTLRHKDIAKNTSTMVHNTSEVSVRPENLSKDMIPPVTSFLSGTKVPRSQKPHIIKESNILHPVTKESHILHPVTKEFGILHLVTKESKILPNMTKEFITRHPEIKEYITGQPLIREYITLKPSNIESEGITTPLPPISFKENNDQGRRLIVTDTATETPETPILATEKYTNELINEGNGLDDGFKDLIPISQSRFTPKLTTDALDPGFKENVFPVETAGITSTQGYESTSTIRDERIWEWVLDTTDSTPVVATVTPEAADAGSGLI